MRVKKSIGSFHRYSLDPTQSLNWQQNTPLALRCKDRKGELTNVHQSADRSV